MVTGNRCAPEAAALVADLGAVVPVQVDVSRGRVERSGKGGGRVAMV